MNALKKILRNGARLAVLALAMATFAGCESTDGGSVSGSVYYGADFYDPWYYGGYYYDDPDIIVTPPPRPVGPPRPTHPIAPTPSPRPMPMPSIPSMPRVSGRR